MSFLNSIFAILPDWAVAVLVAVLLWFGANYLFLADYHFEDRYEKYSRQNAACIDEQTKRPKQPYSRASRDIKIQLAKHTSSFGILENEDDLLWEMCNGD